MKSVCVLVLFALGCAVASAQTQVLVNGQPIEKVSGVVTNMPSNADLSAKAFHLMIIGDQSGAVAAKLYRPQSAALQSFVKGCEIRQFDLGDEFLRQHHMDLLRKHSQLPILAMVDRAGGVWWSAAGSEIPASEADLASTMAYWYAETMVAKQKAVPGGNQLRPVLGRQSYPMQPMANSRGPQPLDQGRRPLLSPHVDVDHNLVVPPNLGASIQGSLDPETRRALYIGGGLLVLCAVLGVIGVVVAAVILGNAITNDEGDKDIGQHLFGVLPSNVQGQLEQLNRGNGQ